MDKRTLRKEILARRMALLSKDCDEKSKVIATEVIELDEFKRSDKVLLYAPIRNEVETKEIYHKAKQFHKEVFYPKVLGKEMQFYLIDESTEFETSRYGICEPKPESTILFEPTVDDKIFVVVPGAVFDRGGNRIGYGGGYYDKYLQELMRKVNSDNICKAAVAYDCQIVKLGEIEKDVYDISVDYVVTEKEVCKV